MDARVQLPSVSATDILEVFGLERRRSVGSKVTTGLGFLALGAVVGATAVFGRALWRAHSKRLALSQRAPTALEVG